jgi:hypothetical protein
MKFRFALAALGLLAAFGAFAAAGNDLSDAEFQGRQLAQQLLEQSPATNFTQTGILKIHDKEGSTTNIFVSLQTRVSVDSWQTDYAAGPTINGARTVELRIIHKNGQPNQYFFIENEKGLF